MTTITRRSFIKRSGAATLTSALGLGLIPSVTSKLKAVDTSSGWTGIKITMEQGAPMSTQQSGTYQGATYAVGLSMAFGSSAASPQTAGTCYAKVFVRWTLWISRTPAGGATNRQERTIIRSWECVGGVPSMTLTQGEELPSIGVPGVGTFEPSNPTSDGDAAGSATAVVTDGLGGPALFTLATTAIGHGVSCCPLSA